mgnify:CR=1 FL=1
MNRETVNMVRSPISVEGNIRLVPYYPAYDTALAWYQDAQLCKQVDNRDFVYDLPLLKRMYHYLDTHGKLFYIEYRGVLCGDVSLRTTGELAIVICKEYQNKHIGRKVIEKMLENPEQKQTFRLCPEKYRTLSKRPKVSSAHPADRILLSPFWGSIILAMTLTMLFFLTFGPPTGCLTDFIEQWTAKTLLPHCASLLYGSSLPVFFADLLCDGIPCRHDFSYEPL